MQLPIHRTTFSLKIFKCLVNNNNQYGLRLDYFLTKDNDTLRTQLVEKTIRLNMY